MNYTAFEDLGGLEFLDYIIRLVNGTKVGFLIENSLLDTCIRSYDRDTVVKILDNFKSDKLSMCLDICHLQASESYMKFNIPLTKEQIKRIKNIHFSMTVDNDGYIDKERTHGRVHNSIESLKNDLKYLEDKGIKLKKVNIVTEINEEDYQYRPDMVKELKLFDSIIV
jgi:endonuclease IV